MRAILIAALTMTSFSANAYDNVYFDGTTPYFDANNTLIFDGVRAKGTGIGPNDAFRFEYKFDLPSLDFIINKQTTYTGIGVFSLSEGLMAINVTPSQPPFTVGGTTYQSNTSYIFTATDTNPFIAKLPLKPGHVMSWLINNPTNDYSYEFYGNNIDNSFNGKASQSVISGSNPILLKGTYYLKIKPTYPGSVKFSLKAFNANNRQLKTIQDGTYISDSFVTDIRDYSKYKIYLTAGQTLDLPKPSSSDIQFTLLNSFGAIADQSRGLPLIFPATKSGYYYLFINNQKGWGGSYKGTASIYASPLSFKASSAIKAQQPTTLDKATAAQPSN